MIIYLKCHRTFYSYIVAILLIFLHLKLLLGFIAFYSSVDILRTIITNGTMVIESIYTATPTDNAMKPDS